ncbi:porin [Caenimonas terrae]|uniref:Porin n=1 Tax=Caenimonas terrae TaxID=696074 RepID=A0ABW0N8K0_9BURK
MKKSLIALAVLASAGVASAQSSVTLFGIVDATLAYGKGSVANKTQLTNSGYNSSRIGFRGTEDLGGGMNASFWLEAGMNNDNGTGAATSLNNQASGTSTASAGTQGLTFNRRSTVSLGGGWGELRLGRDYTPQFWNLTVFDPFGTNGVGTSQVLNSSLGGPVTVRASNSIGYFLPGNLGGFYGQLQHYRGENASNVANDGTGSAIRLGYANGPINVALAYSSTKYSTGDIKTTNIGGQWDFAVAKLMGYYDRDQISGGATGKGGLIGALVPVGPGEIRLAYSTYKNDLAGTPKTNKWALGYVHNLSKRTAVYATYAQARNSGGAAQGLNGAITAANTNSSGYDFGVRHSF